MSAIPHPVSAASDPGRLPRPGQFTAEVDQTTEAEWNALLEHFADASIYQTWAYGAVCWGEKQLSHLVLRSEGAPVAMAQVRIVRVPVLRSGIAYVRWGPLCMRRDSACGAEIWRGMTEALVDEYVQRRGLLLRIVPNVFAQDPIADYILGMWHDMGFVEDASVRRYQTMRVSLAPPVDVLRSQLSSRWRRQLNIAERNGLEIVEGQTDELYSQFLRLYGEMMARKEFDTTVDVNDFERIQQRLPKTHKLWTFICLVGGQPAAGLVVDAIGNTGIYLLAATGDNGLQARGSYLLQWHAMQRLKEHGRQWYDLGGVNQEVNPGVFTFKSGMGGGAVANLGALRFSRSRVSSLSVSAGEKLQQTIRRISR